MNPFDYSGPDFLIFFACLIGVASIAIWFVRRLARAGAGKISGAVPKLDAYETAFLAGGGARSTLLAAATLVESEALEVSRDGSAITKGRHGNQARHHVERTLLSAMTNEPSMSMRKARSVITPAMETIRRTLQQQGLLVADGTRRTVKLITILLVLAALLIGATKIAIGMQRHRPVEFLVLMCFIYFVVTIIILARRPLFRTSAGNAMLDELRAREPKPPKTGAQYDRPATLAPTLVALWGMDALVGYAFYDQLRMANSRGLASGGGSSTSSCSSSSGDGGGGSDGGGGGCGGCGGGGD